MCLWRTLILITYKSNVSSVAVAQWPSLPSEFLANKHMMIYLDQVQLKQNYYAPQFRPDWSWNS